MPAIRGYWRKGMNRADAPYLPLTPDVIGQHLRGEVHIGLYPLGDDDTCWWVAADFDKEAAILDAHSYMKAARAHDVPAALEVSQSGRGAHVWIFFAQATSAATARSIATSLLGEAFQLRGSMHLSSYDRAPTHLRGRRLPGLARQTPAHAGQLSAKRPRSMAHRRHHNTSRAGAGHFIRWAHNNKLTRIRTGAHRWMGPTRPLDDQHRWNIARRLLHEDNLKPDDRLAGLFVLLYAQTAAAICRMTIVDVETDVDPVRLHLGSSPIHLPEPVADLARLVALNRKGHATFGALTPSIWLFPGGQPGRPISTGQLTQRLNRLGIRPGAARSTALFQLATEIPAAILARTLGIHTDVAVSCQRLSAGDWATTPTSAADHP